MKYIGLDGYEWSTKKGFSIDEISRIKLEDEKFLRAEKIASAKKAYFDMIEHIENVGFEQYIDYGVDVELLCGLTEADGRDYWILLKELLVSSVGSRLEEVGIVAADYEIPY